MPELKNIQFQSLTNASYLLREGEEGGRVFILCHGFMSTAQKMWDRFIDRLPEDSTVLAIHGPFPLPTKHENSWRVGYSWFFYDNFKDHFLIDYKICSDYLKNAVEALGFANNPKTIIGFSQGGYASVHMAEKLKNVDHLIGMGCRFKIDNPQWQKPLVIEAVHGEADDVVEWEGAKLSFDENIPAEFKGRLQSFPGVGHKPTEEMLDTVGQWVSSLGFP